MEKSYCIKLAGLIAILLLTVTSACKKDKPDSNEPEALLGQGWRLTWEENFDGTALDTTRWSKIPRGSSDWNNYMSDYEPCYQVSGGQLILRGISNSHLPEDTALFLTGGVYTKDKAGFKNGRLEIRAKLGKATGAWPAFWLLPFDNSPWPGGGEIDIMERLNGESIAYQTVHSYYTYTLNIKDPPQGATGAIDPDGYNVYAVELYADSLSFDINGIHTFTYRRIETDQEGQFPFNRDFYLLLDMQLGGSWVGRVEPADLPMEMWIDHVRFFEKNSAR
jgi:beta-glucanase (GH16 family)